VATSDRRKVELAVLVLIFAALVAFLLPALERARVDIEEATLQSEVAAIRVELLDRIAHRELAGGALPQSDNPLRWIDRVPNGYLGEFDARDARDTRDAVPKTNGVWYFERASGELVYRYQRGNEARFRLVRGADAGAAQAKLAGVGLVRSENVR
jgi:hypothetical protein